MKDPYALPPAIYEDGPNDYPQCPWCMGFLDERPIINIADIGTVISWETSPNGEMPWIFVKIEFPVCCPSCEKPMKITITDDQCGTAESRNWKAEPLRTEADERWLNGHMKEWKTVMDARVRAAHLPFRTGGSS